MSKWEKIDDHTERLKVPYGWVLRSSGWVAGAGYGVHQVFIADSSHTWKLDETPR